MEAREAESAHGGLPFMMPVVVTLSILAVLVAITTLLGHREYGRVAIADYPPA